jgi:hypothetical protein
VIELVFHKELYDGFAVDQAMQVYERFGVFQRSEEEARWVVQVSAKNPEREERLARELANFALGLTIERSGQASGVTP